MVILSVMICIIRSHNCIPLTGYHLPVVGTEAYDIGLRPCEFAKKCFQVQKSILFLHAFGWGRLNINDN